MSKGGDKKVELWGGIISYVEPVPSVEMEAVRAARDAGLLKFECHKESLLALLRRDRNPDPDAEDKLWLRLTNLADRYFLEGVKQRRTMPSGDRAKRLLILAKALGKARSLTDAAMRDDVGDDLFSEWQKGIGEPPVSMVRNDRGSLTLIQNAEEWFKKKVAGLAALEVAAQRAAHKARRERVGGGRPKGTSALPLGYILALADFYRERTATEPANDDGSFAKFVRVFLDAVGQKDHITERHLIEVIQDAFALERERVEPPPTYIRRE
jgi:hypothetical protein